MPICTIIFCTWYVRCGKPKLGARSTFLQDNLTKPSWPRVPQTLSFWLATFLMPSTQSVWKNSWGPTFAKSSNRKPFGGPIPWFMFVSMIIAMLSTYLMPRALQCSSTRSGPLRFSMTIPTYNRCHLFLKSIRMNPRRPCLGYPNRCILSVVSCPKCLFEKPLSPWSHAMGASVQTVPFRGGPQCFNSGPWKRCLIFNGLLGQSKLCGLFWCPSPGLDCKTLHALQHRSAVPILSQTQSSPNLHNWSNSLSKIGLLWNCLWLDWGVC